MVVTADEVEKKVVVGEPRIGEGFEAAKEKAKASNLSFEEPTSGKKPTEECPFCKKQFKHLAKHKCKEKPKGEPIDAGLLKIIDAIKGRLGEQSVKAIVHALEYAKQQQLVDPSAKFQCPTGWVKETGELHGHLIEYLLAKWGPSQSEIYVILISLTVQWYGVIQINFLEAQTNQSKQPDNIRPTGIGQDIDSKIPDEKRTPIDSPGHLQRA